MRLISTLYNEHPNTMELFPTNQYVSRGKKGKKSITNMNNSIGINPLVVIAYIDIPFKHLGTSIVSSLASLRRRPTSFSPANQPPNPYPSPFSIPAKGLLRPSHL